MIIPIEMSLSAFGDKTVKPDEDAVAAVIGRTAPLWEDAKGHLAGYGNVSEEWKFYSKKAGWTLVVKSGERTLVYLIPQNGHFKTNFVFGGKAVEAAKKADLPASVIGKIEEARQYAEGRSFMIDVKDPDDVGIVAELIRIKDRN